MRGEPDQVIRQLREEGREVFVEHRRVFNDHGYTVEPKGGQTIVQILTPHPPNGAQESIRIGVADCSSKDNYNRRLGTQIALGRALKELERDGFRRRR